MCCNKELVLSTDRRRSHVTGSEQRIARNRRRTGRIGSPAGHASDRVKSNTEDRRIEDRHTRSVQQLATYGLHAGLASYYANWSSQHPRRGKFDPNNCFICQHICCYRYMWFDDVIVKTIVFWLSLNFRCHSVTVERIMYLRVEWCLMLLLDEL